MGNEVYSTWLMKPCQKLLSKEAIRRITKSREGAWRAMRSLQNSNLEIVSLTNGLIFGALKMSGKYDLKVFDFIHYVTALLRGCSAIVSYDNHFDNLEISRVEP